MSVYEYLDTLKEDEEKRKATIEEQKKFEAMTSPIKSYDNSWVYSNTLVKKIVKNVEGVARLKMYKKAEKLKTDYNWPMSTCKAKAIGFYYEDDGWHHKKKISIIKK